MPRKKVELTPYSKGRHGRPATRAGSDRKTRAGSDRARRVGSIAQELKTMAKNPTLAKGPNPGAFE